MQTFRSFMEAEEEDKDFLRTLSKLPKSHADLVKGYTFKLQSGNTLKGDDDHIGYVQDQPKEIVVAAPWRYSREMTFLHEVAHKVWQYLMTPKLKKLWGKVSQLNPRQNQNNDEENFAMAYANYYSDHKVLTHHCSSWSQFIENLPK